MSKVAAEPPVVRELFKNRAYESLRARLINNGYAPGTALSERQIAAELGMSKTPVKAALERLEMEGFITVTPQSGILVRDLSDAEIAELYEIRLALEGYVLKTIACRLSPEQLHRWEANLKNISEFSGGKNNFSESYEMNEKWKYRYQGNRMNKKS